MLAFNLLRTLGEGVVQRPHLAAVKIKASRWRLKTVLENIVYCAVRVVTYAWELWLPSGRNCLWFDSIEDLARSRM